MILRAINHGFILNRMTVEMYHRHFSNQNTYYFAGNSIGRQPTTLLGIDIDCHDGVGSLADAQRFAKYIRDNLFPGLYSEPSTGGDGVHAYIVVRKDGLGAKVLNGLFRRLQHKLRTMLVESGCNVGGVEIKGTIPVVKWHPTIKRYATNMKAGQLVKLPRDHTRWDEILGTTVIDTDFLSRLPIPEKKPKPAKLKVSAPKLDDLSVGSITGKQFGPDELAQLSTTYLTVAECLLEKAGTATTTRATVKAEDMAVFLMLLKFFSSHMNKDGTLPTARYQEMWNSLYGAGDISRAWNCNRFKVMRDLDWSGG
jgi:hypothetical protein